MKETLKGCFKKPNIFDMVFVFGLLSVLILYLYKIPLEIRGNDESFYISVAKRLTDGQIFFIDEWHGSQLAGFLMYPIMMLYRAVWDFEGVILRFRYIYLFFQLLVTVVIYMRLREYKLFGVLASIFFGLFTPYDITALCYNVMGLMLVTLTGVFLATAKSNKAVFASGVTFAGAALCCPYFGGGLRFRDFRSVDLRGFA